MVNSVRALFRRVVSNVSGTDEGPSARRDDPRVGDRAVGLFSCPACATTYLDVEMETCSRCGAAVHPVPNGKDLGFT
jgi:hypothetical protein